ncbi:unnamed protein product [Effrenium voratum]|nr:unnamed protein product [Effrenium voratum]
MKVPAHSMRPLSSHALSVDGVIELGLAQEGSPQASEAPTMRKRKSVLFREPKHLPRTASMSADRPGNGGVLPALMSGPDSGLCLGFSVRQAPFPFYRTMVVEVMRRYTLVNLKDSTLWVCDGSGPTMKLEPGRAVAYHPDKHTEFHLDISGVGPHTFTAGFRLSQLFSLAGDGASGASGAGRRGKLQLMYLTRTGGSPGTRQVSCESLEEADSESREVWRTRIKDLKRSETESLDNERWALACVEALEHSAALVLRFSDPVKPQFRMVNRSRHSVVFRQDHVGAPTFKLGPEDVVPFAWFSPPGNGPAAIPKAEEVGTPSLLLGAADLHEDRDDVARTPKHRYHIAQVREHKHLEFSDRAVRRRMTLRTAKPEEPPDLYKVRTVVHQGSLEVHIHPWVRVRNETKWQVLVRDSADQERCKIVDPDDSVDLWPHSHKNEMLFQMKRVGGSQHDVLGTEGTFDWSQPLTLSESMTGYRGFFRQRCGGEANTVEVSVSRDETSGFLRLTLSTCKQEPFLIENRSSHKCKFAPKNATGWVMHLTKGDGECPFFSHLWGGDTCMTVSIGRGEAQDSYDFDLAVPGTHNFKDLTIEVGKVKERPKLVLVKDAVPRRRSIRDKGRKTLVRLNMAFKDPETTAKGKKGVSVSFAPDSFAPSLAGSTTTPVPSLRQWVQFSSTMNTTRRRRPASGRRCCLPLPAARDSARNSRKAALPEQRKNLAGLEWTLDLSLEGIGLAMLDVQLDSGESAEIGYAALKALKVRLSQHTSQTNVEGRAGALAAELSLGSVQLDVGSGDQKHQSKACHSVLRPFTGPLQILSENQEPLPMVHLEALLKLVTENQEDGQAIERGDRSAHYEVRRLELKVQPLGLHIETALVSEVVVWVMDLCSVLQTGKKENYSPEHLAAALDAEAAGDGALVDLKYCEPRCVRDPTADDFKDQTPVVIRELILRRICCVMTLSFTGTGSFRRERNEEVQAFEMLLRLTLPLDVHQARLMLGKIVFGWRGWSVQDFSVRERFLSNGAEELGDTLTREVTRAVLQQVPKLFGSQLLIGNPLRLGEELLRALELAAFGCTTFKPQVVLAAFFLSFAAITTSLRGMFLIISKEACRLSTGQVPDQLLRESARVREAVAQALYYGIPWHCSAVFQRLRGRWRKSQGQRRCEACRATLPALLFSLLAPISVLLVTVTKLLQAMELSSRRTARWVSPKHVTAIGPPLPTRTGSQQFTAGYPKQFSRAAAPALVALTSNAAPGVRSGPCASCQVGTEPIPWRRRRATTAHGVGCCCCVLPRS